MAKVKPPVNPAVAPGDLNLMQPSIDSDFRFRKLIENSFSGISLLDKDLNIIYRSPSAKRITGWNNNERKKNTLSDLTHPADREPLKLLLEEVAATPGLSKTCSFRSKHFSGHFIWLESTYTNMLNEPGIEAIVCNFIDVTEKKQAEESLQQTVNELFAYKHALDESAIVAITDQKGIINHVNENFCRISKYSAEELIGKDHRIINSSYHDKTFIRNLWTTIAAGKIWKGELKNKAKDGSYYWVDTTIVPFLNENGKPYQYVAIRSDITERKLSEDKIIESELFTKTITDNLPALIAYWTADLRCLFANKPHLDWFDKQSHEMKGISKRELLGEDEFRLHENHIQNVLKGQPQRFERTFYKGNGQRIFTDTQYLPDREGDIIKGFYSLIYDVTPVKTAEIEGKKALEERNTILESIDDAFFAVDKNWRVTYWNSAAAKLFGKPKSEMMHHNLMEQFPDWVGSETYHNYFEAVADGRALHVEHYSESYDLWLESSIYPGANGLTVYIKDVTTRKKAEVMATSALEERNIILESIGDAFFAVDKNWVVTYWNNMAEKAMRKPRNEILGQNLWEVFADAVGSENYHLFQHIMETGEAAHYERYEARLKAWVEVSIYPAFNGLSVYIKDISARKEAETAATEVLEERNSILESIDDAFFAVDKNWIVTYWNSTAENIFGKSRSQIVNNNLLEEFPYMVDTEAYKYYCQVLDTGRSAHFEYYSTRYNLWLDTNVYPAESGFTAYMKNVTARKNAESSAMAALKERNTILESIDDAFFAVDKNWVVTYWNKMAEKVLQTPKDKILNYNLWEIFSESVDTESYKKYHEAVETNKAAHFEDYHPPLNKWYEISAYPSDTGLSVYFKDITERKTSETRLKELNASLRKHARELAISNAELEQFAYVASHDLQEPLRMVTSFMSQLEKKYSDIIDDKGKQYIHFAVDGAKRMRQIILDLLEFSRVGRTEDDLEEVNLNNLVDEILALYRKQIEERNARIVFDNLPVIRTYKTPLRQVLQNLIGNSLKYQKHGTPPLINISCQDTANRWIISVKDNGIGIDAAYFDKVFIIFQRLHNKDEYSGTGMGLAITKKIIENLGGKIWIESAEGKGSTFYFTLFKNNKT
jgi:PAS domain S-box-containing protein